MKRIKRLITGALASVLACSSLCVDGFCASADLLYEKKDIQTITKGVTYEKSKRLYKAGWMDVYVLTVDVNEENAALEILESTSEYGLKQTVTKLAQDNNVLAAVNADFFGSGNPKSSMGQVVENGEVKAANNYYNGSENKYAGFFIDSDNVPFIDYLKTTVGFYNSATAVITVGAKNKVTDFSSPVYFDRKAIASTSQLDKRFSKLTKIVVDNEVITKISSPGETVNVPQNGYIIVMNNSTREAKISNYAVGQKVSFNESETFVFRPGKDISKVMLGITGGGELLRNGSVVSNGLIISKNSRNPRTAIGVNKDKSKIYIACVDGRGSSIGATHAEMAGIMQEYGAYDAIHFDGGGSTTMVLREENDTILSLVNTPSEGSQRQVANGLGIVSTKQGSKLSKINVVLDGSENNVLLQGVTTKILCYGFDEYSNPVSIDTSKLRYASTVAGKFNGNEFTPNQDGFGKIVVTYSDSTVSKEKMKDGSTKSVIRTNAVSGESEIRVLSGAVSITAEANTPILSVGQSTELSASIINKDGYSVKLANEDIKWSVDNANVGAVQNGYFVAKGNGVARVTAANNGVSASVNISVGKQDVNVTSFEIPTDMIMYYYPDNEGISGGASVSADAAIAQSSSLKLSYSFNKNSNTTQASYVSFEKQPITLPDNATDIGLWLKGDSSENIFKLVLKDASGAQYNVNVCNSIDFSDWKEFWVEIPEDASHPVTLDKMYIAALATGENDAVGSVYIDNLKVKTPLSAVDEAQAKFSDYRKTTISGSPSNGYEDITVFGKTAVSLANKDSVLNSVMTSMARAARAMVFVGDSSFNNTTGVASIAWNNEYFTTTTDTTAIINLATRNGSIRSSSPNQWRWLQGYLQSCEKNNIIVNMDKNIWASGSGTLSDKKERELLHEILSEYAREKGKTIMVISATGSSNYSTVKDGVRYVNLSGLNTAGGNFSYLRIRANANSLIYEIQKAN